MGSCSADELDRAADLASESGGELCETTSSGSWLYWDSRGDLVVRSAWDAYQTPKGALFERAAMLWK